MSLSTFLVLSQASLDVLSPYKGWTLYFSEGMCATIQEYNLLKKKKL